MTVDEYEALVRSDILGTVELIEGRVLMAGRELVFSPEQARAAAAVGVAVRCCVDAVLEDEAARAEIAARLPG